MSVRFATAFACSLCSTVAIAAERVPLEPPIVLTAQIRPGSTLERVFKDLKQQFAQLDANGDGKLDREDVTLHRRLAIAGMAAIAGGAVMTADLDGDGAVTEEELRIRLKYDTRARPDVPRANADARVAEVMAGDTDHDGRVTWVEEIAREKARRSPMSNGGIDGVVESLLAYADKREGALTPADLEKIGADLFAAVDTDRNGTLSQDEVEAEQRRVAEKRRSIAAPPPRSAEQRAACAFPEASAPAKVLLLSAYEGDAVSTTAIGTQDVDVVAATVAVEPGPEPLYVVLASQRATVWRFTGAVERLERVILGSQSTGGGSDPATRAIPLVGAAGVPAEKVTFLPRIDCLKAFWEKPSIPAAVAAAIVREATGREPVVATRYAVAGFSIPSATIQTSGRANVPTVVIRKPAGSLTIQGGANVVVEAGARDLASEVARYHPGGVMEIDPATVVASRPPARFEVLPGSAGLLQLVREGALEKTAGGEFLIKRKIRFPAGLQGGAAGRFLLLRGVPAPEGDVGHSCVVSEETGRPLNVAGSVICR